MKFKHSDSGSPFENYRQIVGFFLGPALFLFIILIPTPESFIAIAKKALNVTEATAEVLNVAYSSKVVLALLLLMIVWWITETIPIPVTSLLPGIILPIFHVTGLVGGKAFIFDSKNIFMNYANPVIFLFLGGFLLAAAMQKVGLDRRFVLYILTRGKLANNTKLIVLAFISITAFISMWVSNTATAAMLLPLGLGILSQVGIKGSDSNFGKSLMLGIAWGASIGGVGTIIGTPPNGICVSILSSTGLAKINFIDWMKFGIPYVFIFVPVAWFILTKLFPPEIKAILGGREMLVEERKKLGKLSKEEKLTIIVFAIAVFLWISNPFWDFILPVSIVQKLSTFDEFVVALFAAILLFVIPVDLKKQKFVLTWSDAKFVDWGTLLLFGGGIALSDAMFKTGLASWIATSFVDFIGTPSPVILLFLIVLMIDLLSEVTSNTAVVTMMIPIMISIAKGIGADPITLSIGTALAGSLGFMLPVATPPNALVYGTGYIKIKDMVKGGFLLDISGWLIVIFVIYVFAYKIFGIVSF
ncbi:MAG: DASS family sodium-coupled anion symporter [Ignavibacteriales bacterium]|nr:DASS family sodium-coupled anion symporter [Ignavibacteriales bacterium]